jgi:hypothetical protein
MRLELSEIFTYPTPTTLAARLSAIDAVAADSH